MGTVLLLLVLAGWIGVGFWWFTSHRGEPSDATGSFRTQLGTLERRSPGLVPPAHRFAVNRSHVPSYAPRSRPVRSSSAQRAATIRRRRDILTGLALATGATFVLGMIPALRVLWIASVLFGGLLAAYVYVLIQIRDLQASRSFGVPAARPAQSRDAAVVAMARERHHRHHGEAYGYVYEAEPALVRRIAN